MTTKAQQAPALSPDDLELKAAATALFTLIKAHTPKVSRVTIEPAEDGKLKIQWSREV